MKARTVLTVYTSQAEWTGSHRRHCSRISQGPFGSEARCIADSLEREERAY